MKKEPDMIDMWFAMRDLKRKHKRERLICHCVIAFSWAITISAVVESWR